MKCSVVLLLIVSSAAVADNAGSAAGSPVEKVVELLTTLKDQVIMDGKEEQMMYDKTACWCEKATHAKAEAIERAQKELRALGQAILKLKGKIATLTSEIAELAAQIKDNLEAQEEATAVRKKENAEFMAESTETKQALAALEQAIAVLIKGTTADEAAAAAFLQSATMSASIRSVVAAMPKDNNVKADHLVLLEDLASGTVQAKYMPQSLTVQGMLVDMYNTFATNLETATFDEATKNTDFEDFIATKEAELIELEKVKARKEAEKSEAENSLAETTQSYDDTQAQMKADIAFFDETKKYCMAVHEEWTLREAARKEELMGIKKAIAILTTDEARETFASAIKPGKETGTGDYDTGVDIESFLQISNVNSAEAPVMRAYAALKASAAHAHSLRLAQLAASVRTAKVGHFQKVIAAIDTMIKTLKDEEAADIAKRDQCKVEYTKINSTVSDLKWKIKNNLVKIDKLENLIAKRTEEKLQTIEDILKVTEEIKEMEDTRKTENQAFLAAKEEDQKAIDLLKKARSVLMMYYKNHNITMGPIQGEAQGLDLAQQGPEFAISNMSRPEFDLSHKGSRKDQSKGIISIMTMIIEDLNDEIKNGMKSEEETQLDFEKQLQAAKDLKAELIEKKTNLEETIAKRNEELTTEHEIMDGNSKDLQDELDYKASIKPDCDWIIGAFDERDKKREAEMNGLVTAKDFLANGHLAEPSLLQNQKAPQSSQVKRGLANIKFLSLSH